MRYIKQYEGFKIDADFEQDVKDIFVELVDNDYDVEIDFLDKDKGIKNIMINIEKNNFNSNIAKDKFLMLLDYVKIYYDVVSYKFATYKMMPNQAKGGAPLWINSHLMSMNTEYYEDFPENLEGLECMGIDILLKSDNIIKNK